MIDLSGGGEESDNGQRICRICHFGSDQYSDRVSGKSVSVDLIEIGCKCKNELGLSHFHCVEAWFKLRGNRYSIQFISLVTIWIVSNICFSSL